MVDLTDFLDGLKADEFKYLLAFLCIILVASTIDVVFGWLNAKFNKNVVFVSGVALYGIIKKMMYFIVLILFFAMAYMLVPKAVAYVAIVALYTGYLLSEVNSILSHLGLTEDGKKGELFITFVKRIFESNREEK